ncbi:DUF835 domain-containing protein [Candidatus Woesearchaeota archaeon]|nr:DUF835 domain-containing protein [Candidatus Woesearchaeota archaeon]
MEKAPLYGIIAGILLVAGLLMGFNGSTAWTNTIMMISLLAFLFKFGVALWIYLRNPSAKVNRSFAIVFTGQAIWDLGKFFMWMTRDETAAFIWARISYTGYIISVFFLLAFVWAYLKKKNYFTSVPGRVVLYTPMIFLLLATWFSGGIIENLIPPEEMSYGFGIELWDYDYGILYDYFFLWFQALPFLYAFVMFVYKYFHVKNKQKKKQLMYLVVGSAFPIAIGIPTGVILPAMGIMLPPHNNILSLIMSAFIAVGIIKYKFLAIQPVGEKIVEGRKLDKKLAEKYKFDFGQGYFIKHEKSSEIAHKVLLTHLYQKRYGLIITAHNPSKIRHEYGIETTPIVWVTDTETEHLAVDPIDIEQLYETIHRFVDEVPNAIVLIDGLDYLLVHNNFAKMLHFVRQVKRTIVRGDDCLVVTKGALSLEPKQEKLLEAQLNVLPAPPKAKAAAKERARRRRKTNYIIIGHNPLAQSIISELEDRCIVPTVIEKKDILVHYPRKAVSIIKGDPLSRKVLEHAGVTRPSTVVLITLEDDSDVILCINKIRQLSDAVKIITNIHNPNFVPIAMKAGADNVIPSSAIGGRLISLALGSPDIVRWVMDATTYAEKELELIEFNVEKRSSFDGRKIGDIDEMLGRKGNIIAVRTVDGLKQIPDDEYKLKPGDKLILEVNLVTLPRGKDIAEKMKKVISGRKAGKKKR